MIIVIFAIVIFKILLAILIGFTTFKLISGQKSLKKPTVLSKKPTWFLGLATGTLLFSVLSSASLSKGLNPFDSLITFIVLTISYTLMGMIPITFVYLIYKRNIKNNIHNNDQNSNSITQVSKGSANDNAYNSELNPENLNRNLNLFILITSFIFLLGLIFIIDLINKNKQLKMGAEKHPKMQSNTITQKKSSANDQFNNITSSFPYVKRVQKKESEKGSYTTITRKCFYIKSKEANIRIEPTTRSNPIEKGYQNEQLCTNLKYTSINGENIWYSVMKNGEEGWISSIVLNDKKTLKRTTSTTLSNSEKLKLNTIKAIYRDSFNYDNGDFSPNDTIIEDYTTKKLKKALEYRNNNQVSGYENCAITKMYPSNDPAGYDTTKFTFEVRNDFVIAYLPYSNSTISKVGYRLDCNKNSCKVADILNNGENSLIKEIYEECPKHWQWARSQSNTN